MTFNELKALDNQNVLNSYARYDLAVVGGKGAVCKDLDGKEYIDFSSGIGVNSLGFCDEGWALAVYKQLVNMQHISNLYYTEPGARLAAALCQRTGYKKVFFGNSGAEANEGAIKCARKYSFDKYGGDRYEIITLNNSFHGRTITTLKATGQDSFHKYFFPFPEGFVYASASDIADVKAKIGPKTCAVMLEFVQGEGGVVPLNKAYVKELAEICAEKDILLIADEVQTGMGRTGTLFAFEQFGIRPDIITSAKGLGGGLPIGAVLFGEKTEKSLGFGDHGSTFGASPAVAAGALEVVNRLDQKLLDEIAAKGELIKEKLKGVKNIAAVSGLGMMIGILPAEGFKSADIVKSCIAKGLIPLTAKDRVRLLPPLTISFSELEKGLDILIEVFESL